MMGDQYYGAQASINVWSPRVADPSEFSLSQIWVISGSFGNDLNTIEAGWQVLIMYITHYQKPFKQKKLSCGTISVCGITYAIPTLGILQKHF
jgi:Neprosin